MRTKFNGILTLLLALSVQFVFAQKTVSGTVSDETGPLPGVSILIKGTKTGTETDFDGKYSLQAKQGDVLQFSYVGMTTVEKTVGTQNVIDVVMVASSNMLDEVVITALGISRDKKSLGYTTQEIKGEANSRQPVVNFADNLSGQVAGLDVKSSGTIGGSSNIVIRGVGSITGSNQALIVVDGVPMDNSTGNSTNQQTGRGGFDYGNSASDINPNDVESYNVLKGAAATALYGSRGANGVIMITTKKGNKQKGIGVEVKSSYTVGTADKETLPKYQDKYGAGYYVGYYHDDFYYADVDGDGTDDPVTLFDWDGSFSDVPFDPNTLVYQWNSFYEELSTYKTATPWVAAKHTPNDVWTHTGTMENSVAFSGSNEYGNFRVGFTNLQQSGGMPNTSIKKNVLTFNGEYKLSEKLKTMAGITYVNDGGKGRWGTGYDSRNPNQTFRQWWQTNVDLYEQRDAYLLTGKNLSWDPTSVFGINGNDDLLPIYHDNFYWMRDHNYSKDSRDRYYGYASLNYEFTDWLSLLGRYAFDQYNEQREEIIAVGSTEPSGSVKGLGQYTLTNREVAERNYDLIFSIDHEITDHINLNANIGWNLRVNDRTSFTGMTNGGLKIPGLYSLTNSVNALTSDNLAQYKSRSMTDGEYARASIGFFDTYYVEGTFRSDRSSTLPKENNRYSYWSASGSIILSKLITADWMNFLKLRGNYATVGNATSPYNVYNTFDIIASFDGIPSASNPSTSQNPNLEPEKQKSWEVGIEGSILKNRVGFDVSYYNNKTEKLLTPISVSTASGYAYTYQNAGDIVNKGVEVSLNFTPVQIDNFSWKSTVNWAKNTNEVLKLYGDNEYYELANVQGGVSIGAWKGSPIGVLVGNDYYYDSEGNKVVGSNGQYLKNPNQIIGNSNPDWTGGFLNEFKYKNLNLSFLIDVQHGGDVFSLDTWYGYSTGLYDFTAGNNDLGNPTRNSLANGGGIILDGVKGTVNQNADGSYTVTNTSENTTRVSTSNFANPWGYQRAPQKAHVYDASFVKLRQASLSYSFSEKILSNIGVNNLTLSVVGRNLWIIHKNIPYSDPEAGLSAGNVQGYQSGAYPSFREVGLTLNLGF